MDKYVGKTINRFYILEKLGEGGMATIYKALDTRLDREVAIKFLRTEKLESQKAKKRFELEAKALARLKHSNIVRILDFGEYDFSPYLVMEYLEGGSLKDRLDRILQFPEAVQLLIPIARALAYAHKKNVLHRDVKPSNILFNDQGQLMLSDFGVAKLLKLEETLDLTGTNVGVGTPWYMAPEQGVSHSFDHRVDIYSLGIVFYEMVTGRKPYHADTPMGVLVKHINEPLPKPREFNPDLPKKVERVIIKALEKNPDQRYQTMEEFVNILEELDKQEIQALRKEEQVKEKRKQKEFEKKAKQERRKRRKESRKARSAGWRNWIGIGILIISVTAIFFGVRSQLALTPTPTKTWIPTSILQPTETITYTPVSTATFTPSPTITKVMVEDLGISLGDDKKSTVDGMLMVGIPAGEYIMGSEEGHPNEAPLHQVVLDDFWIDEHEVTLAQFNRFIEETGYEAAPCGLSNRHPVTCVDWSDAQAYCQWVGRRLPTEAEWEKAARGGFNQVSYPWGNTEPYCGIEGNRSGFLPTANFDFDMQGCGEQAASVKSFSYNQYGLYDMAGNVWEWVGDWFDFYSGLDGMNPTGPEKGDYKVIRGGSYAFTSYYLRNAARIGRTPDYQAQDVGFRCAASDE